MASGLMFVGFSLAAGAEHSKKRCGGVGGLFQHSSSPAPSVHPSYGQGTASRPGSLTRVRVAVFRVVGSDSVGSVIP